jgi:hypothetical protein
VLPAGLPLLAALGGLGTRWGGWRGLPRLRGLPGLWPGPEPPGDDDDDDAAVNDSELPVGGER